MPLLTFITLRSLYLERRSSMIRNQSIDKTDPLQDFDVNRKML